MLVEVVDEVGKMLAAVVDAPLDRMVMNAGRAGGQPPNAPNDAGSGSTAALRAFMAGAV